MPKRKLSARELVADIRSGLSNAELMEKYGLAPDKLEVVFRKLLDNAVVTHEEVSRRGKSEADERNTRPEHSQRPRINPELAKAAAELVRKGSHDNELMMKFGLSPGQLKDLFAQLVQAGYITAEELEARKQRKTKTCRHCSRLMLEGDDWCKHCGKSPDEPLADPDELPPVPESLMISKTYESPGRPFCVWEDTRDLEPFRAYFQTAVRCIVNPSHFFSELSPDAGYWFPVSFMLWTLGLTALFGSIWIQILMGSFDIMFLYTGTFYLEAALSTLSLVLVVLVYSLLLHRMLVLMKETRDGFRTTFRVVSYSLAPGAFIFVPIAGIAAYLWCFYPTIVGLREVHQTKSSKAVVAVLVAFACVLAVTFGIHWGFSKIRTGKSVPQASAQQMKQPLPSDVCLTIHNFLRKVDAAQLNEYSGKVLIDGLRQDLKGFEGDPRWYQVQSLCGAIMGCKGSIRTFRSIGEGEAADQFEEKLEELTASLNAMCPD